MNNDPYPMPWQIDGLAIRAANGKLILRVVESVAEHPDLLAALVVAPQLHAALQEARELVLDSMRIMRGALRLLAELTAETRTPELAAVVAELAASLSDRKE
jgi:hypothetical protein